PAGSGGRTARMCPGESGEDAHTAKSPPRPDPGGRRPRRRRGGPMQVIATAGHAGHGKSALVRALTGMEADRWTEERGRGPSAALGIAWTRLPSGRRLALVDVPGHERRVTDMLDGAGPVPAAMMVVAA